MLNDAGGGIPQVAFSQVVDALLPGVGDTATDPLAAIPHIVVRLLLPSKCAVQDVTRMTLASDSFLEHGGAGRRVISIVDSNWHAANLPVAVMFVFCAGTLCVTRKTGAGVVAGLVHTRPWKASICIWAVLHILAMNRTVALLMLTLTMASPSARVGTVALLFTVRHVQSGDEHDVLEACTAVKEVGTPTPFTTKFGSTRFA